MSTNILMPALSPPILSGVMARLDRATQPSRVRAAHDPYDRLGGPLLRAMTAEVA